MIDGAVVIEGVCHGVDLREENWRNPTVCPAFRDFGYFALTTAVPPDEPRWALSRERFLEGAVADPDVVAGVVFQESRKKPPGVIRQRPSRRVRRLCVSRASARR